MTQRFTFSRRWLLVCALFLCIGPRAYTQTTTLTGAIQFSTNAGGAAYGGLLWNTLAGDSYYDLWLAQNPDATMPINGPADSQAAIAVPLEAGRGYRFYIFGQPGPGIVTGYNGLNLFFDGDNATPGISVFGPTDSRLFSANGRSTLTLQGTTVTGAGQTFYSSPGMIIVLDGYNWNAPATPPGDVCQAFSFTPGSGVDYFGSIILNVFSAATLTVSLPSAPPGTRITLNGGGFAPTETVSIYAGNLASSPIGVVTSDASGAFTVTDREPQAPYGPEGIFALGQSSGKLGAASLFVTPSLLIAPRIVAPGGSAETAGLGFGAGEAVNLYWGNPRQLLGTTIVSSSGSFLGPLVIAIPINAPPGNNAIVAIGQNTGGVAIGAVKVE